MVMGVPLAVPLNWLAGVAVAGAIAYLDDSEDALVAGVIGMVLGVVVTVGVSLVFPTDELAWSLIAVGYAGLFSGMFGYRAGAERGTV
ncbi:MAG: hypothetical protein SV760_04710 [Halobacteria archaeon]|nr:hypothetical protein [Halobacteria archaeon]